MQVGEKKDIPHRSRYYQGLMDTKELPSGSKDYRDLADTYVIFICQFDPFGEEKCCYTFEERCVENLTLQLHDGTRKIFLNTKGKNREEISPALLDFLDYIREPIENKICDKRIKDMDSRVKKIKQDMKVRERYMTLMNWIEEEADKAREVALKEGHEQGLREGLEEGLREGLREGLQEGLKSGLIMIVRKKKEKQMSVEETAEILEQEESNIKRIYELLELYPDMSDIDIAKQLD